MYYYDYLSTHHDQDAVHFVGEFKRGLQELLHGVQLAVRAAIHEFARFHDDGIVPEDGQADQQDIDGHVPAPQ